MNSASHAIRTALIIAAGIIMATKAATLITPSIGAALLCSALLLALVGLAQVLNRQSAQNGSRRPDLALIAVLASSSLIIAIGNPSAMPRLLPMLGVAAWLASLPRRDQGAKTDKTAPC